MNKAIGATVLSLIIIVGAVTGIYFAAQSSNNTEATKPGADMFYDETYVEDNAENNGDDSDAASTETDVTSAAEVSTTPQDDNTEDLVTTTFTIDKIYDHATEQYTQPRIVFGSSYNTDDFYLSFDTSGKFTLSINPYYGNGVTTGTYKEYDDTIYVVYDDSSASEYRITRDSDGVINSVMVNYGDYDIYFA